MPCFWLKILFTVASMMSCTVLIVGKKLSHRSNTDYEMEGHVKSAQKRNQQLNFQNEMDLYPWCPTVANSDELTNRNFNGPDSSTIAYSYCVSSRNQGGRCVSYQEYLTCLDSFILSIIGNNNCKCVINATHTGFCCENPTLHNHTYSIKVAEIEEAKPVCGIEKALSTRITNGIWAQPYQVPWLVAIFRQSYTEAIVDYVCGGSFISGSFILTAAHCVQLVSNKGLIQHTYKPEDFYVRLGDYNVMSSHDDKIRKVMDLTTVAILPHPLFNTPYKYDNDIALIRLNETVNYFNAPFIKPICIIGLNSAGVVDLDNFFTVKVAGRGKSKSRGDSHAPQLVDLHVLPHGLCQYFFLQPISEKHLCVGDLLMVGRDSCTGDSGGPVMIKDPKTQRMILVGIVSFGRECGRLYPAVYTNVRHYIEWIVEGMTNIVNAQGKMPLIERGKFR